MRACVFEHLFVFGGSTTDTIWKSNFKSRHKNVFQIRSFQGTKILAQCHCGNEFDQIPD